MEIERVHHIPSDFVYGSNKIRYLIDRIAVARMVPASGLLTDRRRGRRQQLPPLRTRSRSDRASRLSTQVRASWAMVALIVLGACTAPSPASTPTGRSTADANQTRPLHIAHTTEPPAVAGKFGGGRSGLLEYDQLFAAQLVRTDYQNH